jgi:hypothetical protein
MLHPLVKIISVDEFITREDSTNIGNVISTLNFVDKEFGKEIPDFNMVPEDIEERFKIVLGTDVTVNEKKSGIFRHPSPFIHFESFEKLNEWIFVVALDRTLLNIYENLNGSKTALEEYKLNYRNLHDWDLIVSYDFKPGQGVLFRPWLFHSFSGGLIQIFRLEEKNARPISNG